MHKPSYQNSLTHVLRVYDAKHKIAWERPDGELNH
jgi:hypothetical protein